MQPAINDWYQQAAGDSPKQPGGWLDQQHVDDFVRRVILFEYKTTEKESTMTQSPDTSDLPIEIDVATVSGMLTAGEDFLLLDVREPSEFAVAKIEGSQLIPMGELGERLDEIESYRDRRIVVHCHHGGRSLRVTQALRTQGFTQCQNMSGGIDVWSQEIDESVPRY